MVRANLGMALIIEGRSMPGRRSTWAALCFWVSGAEFLSKRYCSDSVPLTQKQRAAQVLLRPGIDLPSMINAIPRLALTMNEFDTEIIEEAEIQLKYAVYIEKEKELVQRMAQLEDLLIPDNFNYDKMNSLSTEALQKLKKIRPRTLGQASRISGVNPSDVQILMVYMVR